MFLRGLELENVRSIPSISIDFSSAGATRKWTLLFGQNGCGKSTILKAIALLTAGSEALPELLGDPNGWIRNGCSECWFRAEFATAEDEFRQVAFSLRRNEGLKETYSRNAEFLDQLDRALAHSTRNYFTLGYGVSRRFSRDAPLASSLYRHPRAQSVATMFSPDATLQPLDNWAADLDYRYGAAGLAIVEHALADLLPGVRFAGIDKQTRRILFETEDGNVPFERLSDGYQNVASWCGDLLFRITQIFANYTDPLQARGLLLIDEIDLHLHPVWQRKLREYLDAKLPNLQIIATSHSPFTAQQSLACELHFLRRNEARQISVTQFEGEPRKLMLHQILVNPLFGLETLDSRQVEELRERHRSLSTLKDAASRKQAKSLASELAELPDWHNQSLADQEQIALLRSIQQSLAKPPAKKAVRRKAKP